MNTDDNETEVSDQPNSTDLHSSTYNLFILVLTIFSLVVMVVLLLPRTSTATKVTLQFIDTLICLIFLGDFFSNLNRAPDRRAYFLRQGGWLDLLGSIPAIPGLKWTAFLRLARLGRLARIIRFLRTKDSEELWKDFKTDRAKSVMLVTIFTALLIITVSAVVVLQIETRSEGANILTGGDAFWWALVTVTTVGYGDQYPVSGLGRLMAVPLMIVGVGIFGVLSSFLASIFIGTEDEIEKVDKETAKLEENMAYLKVELTAIKEMLRKQQE